MARRDGSSWLPGRLVLKAWFLFLAVFGGQMALLSWADPWLTPRVNAATAQMTAWALRLLGQEAHVEGPVVDNPILSIEVVWECTGITAISLFLSAVVAYPCPWSRKLQGLAWGVPALLLINIVRIVSLIYIGHWFPRAFENAHVLVWQSLFIFFTVILWLVWITKFVEPRESATT